MNFRTDIALERRDLYKTANNVKGEIDGIECKVSKHDDIVVTCVKVLNEKGASILDKKIGNYITIDIKKINNIDIEKEKKIIDIFSNEIKDLINHKVSLDDDILIVGLGNLYSTPDSLGSKVVENIEITRHIKKYLPNAIDKSIRSVSAINPGVMGTTGIETIEIVKGIVEHTKPKLIIAVDSLCSKNVDRINKSIQISDTGITPGGGVGNRQEELSEENLGVPVIGVGVPTVLDAATIALDTLDKCDIKIDEDEFIKEMKLNGFNFIVTPKEIDAMIDLMANILSEGINSSL